MPLGLNAVFVSVVHGSYSTSVVESLGSGFLQVSGVTANYPLVVKFIAGSTADNAVTRGFGFSNNDGNALLPFRAFDTYAWNNGAFSFALATTSGASVATYENLRFASTYEHTNAGTWNFTQDSSKNVKAQIADYQSVTTYTVFESYEPGALQTPQFFKIWEVKMFGPDGSLLQTNSLNPRADGQQPFTVFPSTVVSVTGEYFFSVARKYRLSQNSNSTLHLEGIFSSVLTASAVTSGGGETTNMFSWLNNSYWYLTDLQVNLGTRAVTHRHGAIQLRPADTINFAILFHDGTAGINPQATDIKLAVRSSNNTSPYHFWSATTVSTVTVSGDVYYAITVTASDDDLLTAQAANLLAGSNADQSLLGEIQWTTTRGTFSSDTFTINVPSEVVREPDV
jgi:hypothetical protein